MAFSFFSSSLSEYVVYDLNSSKKTTLQLRFPDTSLKSKFACLLGRLDVAPFCTPSYLIYNDANSVSYFNDTTINKWVYKV